jgi:hypothetical protein
MKRIWSEYNGKKYNFQTSWTSIEKDTQPIISHWIDRNLEYSCLISLWNSRTKTLWVVAEFTLESTIVEVILKSLTMILKLVFPDSVDAWRMDKYLHFGSPMMFSKAIGKVSEGFINSNIPLNEVKYDEAGSIFRLSSLFYNKGIIIHSRTFTLHEKIMTWTMDENLKTPQPLIQGFGLCRALCLTASAIWESGFVVAAPKEPKPYARSKQAKKSGINDWMKIV